MWERNKPDPKTKNQKWTTLPKPEKMKIDYPNPNLKKWKFTTPTRTQKIKNRLPEPENPKKVNPLHPLDGTVCKGTLYEGILQRP